jgi:integrase
VQVLRGNTVQVTTSPPLTVKRIESLKPKADRFEVSDAATGLRIRVTPNGVKAFRWSVHTPTGQRVITLGRWAPVSTPGHLTLAQARDWLEKLKTAHRAGQLELVEAELAKVTRPPPPPSLVEGAVTVGQVAEDFLRYIERERKRPEQARRPIEKDIVPAIGKLPITSITAQDCRRIVEAVVARGSPRQAGVVLAILKQFFGFAVDRGDLESNPAERFRNPRALGVENNVCQRILSPEEIAAFWRALDTYRGLTPTVRNGLRILLLTGVRSGELLQAGLEELNFEAGTWTIPVAHQKLTRERERTARPWVVPLAPTAFRLFQELDTLARSLGSAHLMASFHAKAGEALTEKSLNHAMRRLFEGDPPLLTFEGERPTPHDLRRTVRTGLGELGVQWHVAERCLNHSLGKIATTYDVGDYLNERRTALEKWDEHVQALIHG